MDTTLSDPLVGRLLEGRYAIEAFIAHGGMASVYLATDTRLERRVAVKVLHAHLSDDDETVARFEREARAAARLSSPDVVAVYDQGSDAGRAFLVMEFVPGANLRHVVRDRGRLTPDEALAVMDHVLSALAAAHNAGLVHRDVKPENVLVTADGRVKVADFGLARAVAGSTVTTTGSVLLGTAAYLAPEQFELGTADARSDVYSAGVLLFELLTGSTPFQADSAYALLSRHAKEDIPAPSTRASGIAPQLDALVTWATSRDPAQRPTDAAEFHDSLLDVRDRLGLHGGVPPLPIALTTRIPDATTVMPAPGPPKPAAPRGPQPAATTQVVPGGRPPRNDTPVVARAKKPRRSKRNWIIAAVVVLVVVLSAVAGWWIADGRYTDAPHVVGLSKNQADAKLKAAGLHDRWLSPVYSLQTPKGLVAAETNDGRVTHGSTVDLRLSLGPRTHALPSLVNETVSAATAALAHVNIGVSGQVSVHSLAVAKGLVVGTVPPVGTMRNEGTKVQLKVSIGKPHVVIPPVNGMSQDDATVALTHAGFTVTPEQRYSNSVSSGDVISSQPHQGHKAIKGSAITLIVSQGPRLFQVPDVRGESVIQATKDLKNDGFVPNPVEAISGGPGTVLEEKPLDMEPHGTTIELDYF